MRHWFVLLLFCFVAGAPPSLAGDLQTFDKSTLQIATGTGPQLFHVELALTPAQQEQGLMYRSRMDADAGMLFDFNDVAVRTFWMKNTIIPLDMLFIGTDGKIVDIHERAVPMSEALIPSAAPARAVLELNGGTVSRLGIKVGDLVSYKGFGTGGG